MTEPVILKNKAYISAKDAAELTGYTSDYIGQLARAGQFDSQLVGRSRFVEKEGLLEYVRTSTAEHSQTAEPKAEVFISTKEAAELTGYTSDYIGQLARGKKIPSKMVGRARLVGQTSLLNYAKDSVSNTDVGGRKPHTKSQVVEKKPAEKVSTEQKEETRPDLYGKEITFVPESNTYSIKPISAKEKREPFFVLPADFLSRAVALIVAVIVVLGSFALYEKQDISIVALIPSSITETPFDSEDTLALVNAFEEINIAENIDSTASGALSKLGWAMYKTTSNFLSFMTDLFAPYVEDSRYASNLETSGLQDEGLVVIPSSYEDISDEERLKRVQDSFSDEVVIETDEDGRSGIIQPVFRTQEGESFLYVLVPVDEDEN